MSPAHDRIGLPVQSNDGEREDDEVTQNPHPRLSQSEANLLALMAAGIKNENGPSPKSSWATAPIIISMIVSVLSIGGSAVAVLQGYTQLGDRMASFGERMLTMDGRMNGFESLQREGAKDRASLNAVNIAQDGRLTNQGVMLENEIKARQENEADLRRQDAELRGTVTTLGNALGEIRADLKVLVDRAQRPRTEIPQPERDAQVQGPQFHPR